MAVIEISSILTGIHITHTDTPAYEQLKKELLAMPQVRTVAEGGINTGNGRRVGVIVPCSGIELPEIMDHLADAGVDTLVCA